MESANGNNQPPAEQQSERRSPAWIRFGEYIETVRRRRELTQGQVADKLNEVSPRSRPYTQSEVSAYESGSRLWPEVVTDYIRAFDLDRHYVGAVILGDDFDPQSRALVLENLILSDPDLDDYTQRHMIRQYALLRAATAQWRRDHGGEDRPAEDNGDI